ncbi:phosphatase PAP2 family protein [Streptomyces sp. NPDC090112]|uniref:phosphatase PAP2 family protein n=1 Tax=Streptomyces sp. NPDC090112 TaxID=3365949 RepID=UPI003815DEA2
MTSHTRPAGTAGGDGARAARRRLLRELLLVAGFFTVYKAGRLLSTGRTDDAFRNAERIWDAERVLHLPGEGAVQRLLLHGDALVTTANTYYAAVHFPATALFLIWLYVRRPGHYLWTRRVLAVLTAAALVLHLAYPLAPPRMLATAGLIDTGQVYGPTVYHAAPDADTLANQFAAMPSLHFGWALMLAIGVIVATRPAPGSAKAPSRLRLLWLLHPLVTLLVIVGTANHYWLDAVVAAVLLAVALLLVPRPRPEGPAADDRPRADAAAGPGTDPDAATAAVPGTVPEAAVPVPSPRTSPAGSAAVGAGK